MSSTFSKTRAPLLPTPTTTSGQRQALLPTPVKRKPLLPTPTDYTYPFPLLKQRDTPLPDNTIELSITFADYIFLFPTAVIRRGA